MSLRACSVVLFVTVFGSAPLPAGDKKPYTGAACAAEGDSYFRDEVWTKVGARKCLTCHKPGGDAADSAFVLKDPRKAEGVAQDEALRHNRDAFAKFAAIPEKDAKGQARLLLKPLGKLDHGGGEIITADSTEYRVLNAFVRRVNNPKGAELALDPNAGPFFEGVVMLDDARLLRRVTLQLAGRLPTGAELAAVAKDGRHALPAILDAVMKEEAFYLRLREGFNDIFLTAGVDGNPDQSVLSYEHFEKTRLWYQKFDLGHIADEAERRKAGYKLAADYRKSLLEEPMRLVEYVVRNDRPFTEIVTADYIMVSPYSARGYGVFEPLKGQFKNPDDPFEFVPVKLKALVGRSKPENQDSATGYYPHAGLLSTFQYLARYPTTETNRNRLRARMYYQHFLGVDVLELAARVSDAATAQTKFAVPTMQAPECAVCHKTLDPVAGLFQDYWRFAERGVYGKRKGGWFTDMFGPGFEGERLPASERWRALQWLGERTAKDPRFAVTMTEHVYYVLTGRRALLPPKDIEDPLYPARARAYLTQRKEVERVAAQLAKSGFNLKVAFKEWIASDFYRADGLATVAQDPARRAELDDVGVVRMLTPEQLERKIGAVFGARWGRLEGEIASLYGAIDSKETTDRPADPSGAMGAIQRIMSNDVACKNVARDFARPAKERVLFPGIEPEVVPGASADGDRQIRQAIAHLHRRLLGQDAAVDSGDVSRTFKLFAAVVADAKAAKGVEKREAYGCRQGGALADDPQYTVRAWRAVVTYLLRQPAFLYE
ncbi:hypothetical protein R5W23_002231 [Gemmata sp. JC673]|uniref:Cytochrome c domain-containing protein n=1 Tax=Gemmata algarum TaxID=2975278 RepID=A0ABU5F517_9BACT|nr:hypothetical protein [Gemmata algarum]MDY3560981.1 hypothetical protein [Gemmata algarum]